MFMNFEYFINYYISQNISQILNISQMDFFLLFFISISLLLFFHLFVLGVRYVGHCAFKGKSLCVLDNNVSLMVTKPIKSFQALV